MSFGRLRLEAGALCYRCCCRRCGAAALGSRPWLCPSRRLGQLELMGAAVYPAVSLALCTCFRRDIAAAAVGVLAAAAAGVLAAAAAVGRPCLDVRGFQGGGRQGGQLVPARHQASQVGGKGGAHEDLGQLAHDAGHRQQPLLRDVAGQVAAGGGRQGQAGGLFGGRAGGASQRHSDGGRLGGPQRSAAAAASPAAAGEAGEVSGVYHPSAPFSFTFPLPAATRSHPPPPPPLHNPTHLMTATATGALFWLAMMEEHKATLTAWP